MKSTNIASQLKVLWKRLPLDNIPSQLAARSSHNLALYNNKAYIFGGELKPRQPIGNEVIVVDLESGNGNQSTSNVKVLSADDENKVSWPSARVGAGMTAHSKSKSLFLWGGRGGKEMKAFDVRSTNQDDDNNSFEDIWRFDLESNQWSQLRTKAEKDEDFPPARSYHTVTSSPTHLYLHAGCLAQGRSAALHSLDLDSLQWKQLKGSPEPARGGTVITTISSPKPSEPELLARWGGFCGHELGGPLDIYDPTSGEWTSHEVIIEGEDKQPSKRSVHGFVPFKSKEKSYVEVNNEQKEIVAILFMGEGEGAPAELGHDGAGKFLNDIYALLRDSKNSYSWLPLHPQDDLSGASPKPRGWFAFDAQSLSNGKGIEIVIHGGLNEANERLSDAWILQIALDE